MATVGIIGLGYVGLPLAVAFAQEGCEVIAVDVDSRKIAAIGAGDSYIEDVPSERLRELSGRIHATTRYARLAKADAVLICVPTPLTPNREPDLGPLLDSERFVRVDPELVRPPERTPSVGDPSRARERLGWEPSVGFSELVERMVRADLRSLQAARAGSGPAVPADSGPAV